MEAMMAKLARVRTSTLEIAYEDSGPAAYHQHHCRGGGLAMKRRDFIGLVGGAAAASWPLAASAQQTLTAKVYRLGTLTPGPPVSSTADRGAILFDGLAKRGYVLG